MAYPRTDYDRTTAADVLPIPLDAKPVLDGIPRLGRRIETREEPEQVNSLAAMARRVIAIACPIERGAGH